MAETNKHEFNGLSGTLPLQSGVMLQNLFTLGLAAPARAQVGPTRMLLSTPFADSGQNILMGSSFHPGSKTKPNA
eukprot:5064046-Amphidinium_carterae.1